MKVNHANLFVLFLCLMFATTIRNAYQETWWMVGLLGGLMYLAYLAVERSVER